MDLFQQSTESGSENGAAGLGGTRSGEHDGGSSIPHMFSDSVWFTYSSNLLALWGSQATGKQLASKALCIFWMFIDCPFAGTPLTSEAESTEASNQASIKGSSQTLPISTDNRES